MATNPYTWLSIHCFPKEINNELLVKGLLPFVKQLQQAGQMQQYFYIRYPEGGFHYRLRLQVQADQQDAVRRATEQAMKGLEGLEKYEWKDYEPEEERYGGPVGVEIAEWQFHVSSEIAGYLLATKQLDYGKTTWLAMTMHMAFLRAMGLDETEARRFCEFSSWAWVSYAVGETDVSRMSQEEILVGLEGVFSLFEKAQAEQPEMQQQLQILWKVLVDEQYELDDWLKQWMAGNRQVKQATEQRWSKLQPRSRAHRYPVRKEGPADAAEELRWSLYADYLHMLNNRLGIKNRDEAYISWCVGQSFNGED